MMGDPTPIFEMQNDAASSALLRRYQQIIFDQLENVSLDGLSDISHIKLRMRDIYIERTLAPLDLFAAQPIERVADIARATLLELLRAPAAQILLVGTLGSGKSMCLRHVAHTCVALVDSESTLSADFLHSWGGQLPLPVLLSAPQIARALRQRAGTAADQLWHAIEDWFRSQDLGALLPSLQHELAQGHCLLLIDGLDEILEAPVGDQIVAALNHFIAHYTGNRWAVACDSSDMAAVGGLRGFRAYTPEPLERSQIDAMIERWYAALAASPHMRLSARAAERAAALQGLLHGNELLEELAASPLTLALWILVHAEGHTLPAARGFVLRRMCDLLLNGWSHGVLGGQSLSQVLDIGIAFTAAERLALLEALALQFDGSAELDRVAVLSRSAIEPILALPLQSLGIAAERIATQVSPRLLLWLCRRRLLAPAAAGAYKMPRVRLCDYMALHALAAQPDFVERVVARGGGIRRREVLPLVVYELAQGAAPQLAAALAERLMHEAAQRAAGGPALLLAASCLEALDGKHTAPALQAEARRELVALLSAPQTPLAERIQAGALLGQLGDPRLTQLLPPMVQVGAGPFLLGRNGGYDDEGPEQFVHIPAFAISIYPVTNLEYALYLDDTSHQPPRYWHDARFNKLSYPVVGITWHEAMAYCAWLDARLGQAGLRAPDMVVRLPLETEWEKAASWDPRRQAKRLYPWGDEWSNERANTATGRGDWMTTPVGCYPSGVSAYGLHDCIGNVWEWTASVYRSYPGAAASFEEAGSYTLRGSSCISLPTHARCTFRSRLLADYWRYHLGFRIVIARPISV